MVYFVMLAALNMLGIITIPLFIEETEFKRYWGGIGIVDGKAIQLILKLPN